MPIYWISQGASKAHWLQDMSDEAVALVVTGATLVMSGIVWFLQESEPELPEAAVWQDIEPCYPQ